MRLKQQQQSLVGLRLSHLLNRGSLRNRPIFPTEKIVADGDTVVWIGRCHWRNKHDGKELNTPKIDVWTFRNGKAVRFFEMFDSLGFARAASLI